MLPVHSAEHRRAVAALEAIFQRDAKPECDSKCPSVRVVAQSKVAAYAFSDGALFVTRGLLGALDDLELRAALAHEIGHVDAAVAEWLQAGSSEADPFADARLADAGLPGIREELRADRIGRGLLARAGLPAEAMTGMVRTLSTHAEACYQAGLKARLRELERLDERVLLLAESS